MSIKSIQVKYSLTGQGVANFNGCLNTEMAIKYGVLDSEVLIKDGKPNKNYKLPNFVIKNNQAHLMDSACHIKSKLNMNLDCRQQVISYLNYVKDGNRTLHQFLAKDHFLLFGYLAPSSPNSLKRNSSVMVSPLVDKNPTNFFSKTVTQRCIKERDSTSLSYTVEVNEVEMEGELLINISELAYIPIGNQRDRPALSKDHLIPFTDTLKEVHQTSSPFLTNQPQKYVRKNGSKDLAEEALILSTEVVTNLIKNLLTDLSKIEYQGNSHTRKFKEMEITVVKTDGSKISTNNIEELTTFMQQLGIYVDYEVGVGFLPEQTEEEKAAKEQVKKDKKAANKPKKGKGKKEEVESEEEGEEEGE
jgi:hypothetical protein